MASTSTQVDDELTQSPSLKRKRTSNDSSTQEQEVFDFDENELNKYYKDPGTSQVEKLTTRKRKYLFKTDIVAPKKCRKFYFINERTTKPRRPKITKPAKVEEKKLEPVPGRRYKLHFARSDGNGNICLMHRWHLKSDLFFNDEKKYNYESFKKLDLAFHIVDEIALEGLDGITLEAFWKRLKYVFPNNISKSMADRIWRYICHNKRMNFYVLKDPREELIFFDRYKYLDVDSGMFLEPFIEFKDIYPLASVNGTEIRGSCSTFNTRKENNGVRKFSMDKALKLYDQKLVFVADQTLRSKALINEEADPNIELLDVEYCMLEKIGRSRDQGEFTQGKMSLTYDSKKVYHNKKVLSQNNLTVHQNFSLKSFALQQNISGGLIHLSRFYHKRKTKQIAIMERIAQMLRKKPNYQIEFTEFRKIFGRNVSIVKIVKTAEFRKYFKILTFPYRKLYPSATPQEYLHKNKQKERQVRVLRMLDPYENITALMEGKEVKDNVQEEKDNSPGCKLINYEYLRDIFLYILSCEKTGATIHQIHDYFKTDFYSIRMAVRKLLMRNVISSSKIDLGRQQSLKFFAKCFATPGCQIQTQPKTYQLSEDTLSRVLKGYDNVEQKSLDFFSEPEATPQMVSVETQFKLDFEPFCCTAFLTETVDACGEELTIYDIVIKGRDKLLLNESNLSTHYINEWDDYLLKRDDFSKGFQLFINGFGKVIYDFLTTIRISDGFQVDNQIVFSIDTITADAKVGRQFNTHQSISIAKNYNSPHSDSRYIDIISKVYVFEAMFNEMHKSNQTIAKLKRVYERFMILNGKIKREGTVSLKPEIKIEVEVSNNVVMEKFMGSEPILEWCAQDEEVTTEIFASTKPKEIINSETILITDDVDLTQRYINRANLILKTVRERKIVPDVTTVYKDILKEEGEEGYDKRACKKSIVSIIAKLVSDGYIKCYKVVMTGKNATRTQCFICVHEIDSQDSFIKSTIDQLKLKFYLVSSNAHKTITIKKKITSPFSSTDVRESITELKQLTSFKSDLHAKCDRTKGKEYGYAPKFLRMRVLHEHLFYVIREHTEREPLISRQVFDLCKNLKIKMTANEMAEMPPIYRNEVSWKMFIPALPQHIKWPKGWTLACYIVLRMPLSVFVKLYNISYDIPELHTYLNHPIKRHYLVKHLPVNIRNVLLHRRKYFHSIYETICNLCYIGLLQLGPRNFKEKDQLFLYLNARTSLYDTCCSKPGYNLIEKKKYKKTPVEFKTGSDVEIYWSEVMRICMNTELGKRKVLDGQLVTIEDCALKPEMVETLKAKTFEQAVEQDEGEIPGDHRGSAGFDSSLWSFVKRNWMWSSPANKTVNTTQSEVKKEKNKSLPPPIQNDLVTQGGPPDRKIYLKAGKSTKKCTLKFSAIKKLSKKKIVRKIVAPRKKRVREYCDAIDRSIMKKNPGIRVEWTEEEDQLLRYCRVASLFLCPVFRKQFIPYNILRDVVHRIHPRSKDKTARAIQRRIYGLLLNDETIKIMETKVENLLNSDTISKYFEQYHSRYKNGIKITDSQLSILFIYLMSYISKHKKEIELLLLGHFASFDFFSDSNIADFETLLHSSDDGSNTVIYSSPKTVEDITQDTIKSIVHCSMACKKNSVGWTYQLSRIYKKFEDDLIRTSVSSLKKDQFFVQNKGTESKTIDNTWPAPIKFSHVYNLMKTASYTIEMFLHAYKNFVAVTGGKTEPEVLSFIDCNELNSFWEKSTFIFDVPEMGIILNSDIDDHSEVIEELAKRFRMYLEQIHEKTNVGKNKSLPLQDAESSNSLQKNLDEIKDEVRHLIFRVPYLLEGNLEMYFKKMLDSNTSLEVNNYIYLMVVDLKKFSLNFINVDGELKNFIGAIEDNNCIDDQQKLVKSLSKIVFAIQSMHQTLHHLDTSFEDNFKMWEVEIWNEVRTKKDEDGNCHKGLLNKNYASGMETCIKRAQDGDFPSLEEIKEGIMSEIENAENRKIPHITDLIMLLNEERFPELDVDNETIEKMKGHFVMQYPKLKEFSIENLEEMQKLPVTQDIINGLKQDQVKNKLENKIKEPRLDSIMEYILDRNGIQNDIKVVEQLIDFVKGKKELGANGHELKKKFVDRISFNLVELLEFLTQMNVFLRTGIASIVYVHHEYQAEWLTESFTFSPKEKEIFESKGQDMKKNLRSLIGDKLQLSDPLKVQLKPWTKLDGSINDDIFHDWLCLILSRCIDFPNIPFLILCEHFHYIKPVDIYSILEVLQEIGCIIIYVLNRVENSLLSKRCVLDEREATCLDAFEDMFVKPTNVSGLCFGSFLDKDVLEYGF